MPSCTKSTLLYETGQGNPVRVERVAREGKSESARVGREGMWCH
jgi:hypothetical protein